VRIRINQDRQKRLQGFCLSVLAALMGLFTAQAFGALWWPAGAGFTLTGIGLVSAGSLARLLAVRCDKPVLVVASGIGAMAACFFAGSTAELLPSVSLEWMWKVALYSACLVYQ